VLLIPIGAEEDGSRRTPFITIALIAANVLWYVVLNFSPGGTSWKADVDAARRDLETYWSQHPSLTPPASLVRLLSADEMDDLLADVKAAAVDRRPETAWLEEIERRELELRARRLEEALANRPSEKYGFVPARPSVGGALGSLFTHGGLVHLGGNMLFLWATGPFLESVLGAGAFLVFYLAGGIAALLTHWLASGASAVPLVGASGAIAAVMGGLLVSNAGARIRFFFLPILWLPRFRFVFGVPALVVLPLWFLEQVASARLEPDAPVAWWAHIGGFAFGMAVAGVVRMRRSRAPKPAVRRRVAAPPAAMQARAGRSRLRVAVVSTGVPGGLLVTRGPESLMKRTLEAAEPGALSLDEVIDVADGPADLRVELRLSGSAPRVASVLAVLRKGEARVLRVEPRPSGLTAEIR
jgi:membrane associated rhomboid family serine protease